MIQASTAFPSIDYASHPAFRDFQPAQAQRDAAIEAAIRQADEVLEAIHASPSPLPADEIEQSYKAQVLPQLETIGRSAAEALPAELPIAKIVEAALAETREELLKEALFHNEKKRFRPIERSSASVDQIARDLTDDGLSLHRTPQVNDSGDLG